ncbi:MAG: alpha/beta fold hydrolase [Candidatus Rokubacteria bacterium]|nr:alpha/beta fold hydrolase [Candidatus Rokubacteria bacterium]
MRLLTWAAVLAAAFVAFSLLSFWLAVRPPRLHIPGTPADHRLRAEDVRIPVGDGVILSGWLAPRPGAPAVLLLHGYPANKADLLPLAASLSPDFGVLLIDHRYFGQGDGARVTTLGHRERGDTRRALDLLAARGHERIGVFGFSMGGAVALMAAAEDSRVRAVAAYAPFADLRALAADLYGWLGPLRRPFVGLLVGWSQLLLGADITRPTPVSAARALEIPVLLIASRDDDQIPFRHAEDLREALRGNPAAELLVMEGGGHGGLPPAVRARMLAFFREHLSSPRD